MSDFFEKRGGRNPLDPFRGGFLTKKGREKRKKNPFGKKEEQSPSAILGELVHGIVQGEFARRGVLGAAEALLVDIPRGMNSKVDAIMASGEIVEIKSVSLRELKGMTAPRPEHAAQALYYLSQIKTSVQDFATVLYVAREAPGVRKAFRVYPGGRHEQVDQMATNYMVERRGGVSDSKFNFSMTGGVEEQVSNEGLKSEFFDKMAEYRRQRRIVYDRLEKQGRDKAYKLATAGLREENDVKGFGDGLAGALRLEWGSAWRGKRLRDASEFSDEEESLSRREKKYQRDIERRARGRGILPEQGNPSHHVMIGSDEAFNRATPSAYQRKKSLKEYLSKFKSASQWRTPTVQETHEFLSQPLSPESSLEFAKKYQFTPRRFENGRFIEGETRFPFIEHDLKKIQQTSFSEEHAQLKLGRKLLLKEERRRVREIQNLQRKKSRLLEKSNKLYESLKSKYEAEESPYRKSRVLKKLQSFQKPSNIEAFDQDIDFIKNLFDTKTEDGDTFPQARKREGFYVEHEEVKYRERRLATNESGSLILDEDGRATFVEGEEKTKRIRRERIDPEGRYESEIRTRREKLKRARNIDQVAESAERLENDFGTFNAREDLSEKISKGRANRAIVFSEIRTQKELEKSAKRLIRKTLRIKGSDIDEKTLYTYLGKSQEIRSSRKRVSAYKRALTQKANFGTDLSDRVDLQKIDVDDLAKRSEGLPFVKIEHSQGSLSIIHDKSVIPRHQLTYLDARTIATSKIYEKNAPLLEEKKRLTKKLIDLTKTNVRGSNRVQITLTQHNLKQVEKAIVSGREIALAEETSGVKGLRSLRSQKFRNARSFHAARARESYVNWWERQLLREDSRVNREKAKLARAANKKIDQEILEKLAEEDKNLPEAKRSHNPEAILRQSEIAAEKRARNDLQGKISLLENRIREIQKKRPLTENETKSLGVAIEKLRKEVDLNDLFRKKESQDFARSFYQKLSNLEDLAQGREVLENPLDNAVRSHLQREMGREVSEKEVSKFSKRAVSLSRTWRTGRKNQLLGTMDERGRMIGESRARRLAFELSFHMGRPSVEESVLPLADKIKALELLSRHEKTASRRKNLKGRFDFFIDKIKESGSTEHLELQIESDLLHYAQDLNIERMPGDFGFEPLNGKMTPLKDTSYFKQRVLAIRKELKENDLELFEKRVGPRVLPSEPVIQSAELNLFETEEKWKKINEAKKWARSNPLSDELPEKIRREKERVLNRKNRRRDSYVNWWERQIARREEKERRGEKRASRAIHPDAREAIKRNAVDFIGETTVEQELKKPRLNSALDPKKVYTIFDIETTISRSKSRLPFFTEFAATQVEGSEIFGKDLGDLVKTGSERSSRLTAALPEEGLVNRVLKAKNIDEIFEERPGHVLNQEYKKAELQKATQRFLRAQSHTNPIDAAKTPDLLSFVQSEMREIADTHMKRDRGRWVYSDSMASKIDSGKVSTTGSLDVLYGEQEKITQRALGFFEKTQKAHGSLNLVGHNIESFDIPMLQSFFKQEGLNKGVELLKNAETIDTLRGKAFRSMFDRINLISAGEHGELMTTLTTKIEKGGRKESIRTLSNLAYSIGAIDSTEFAKAHSADFDVARASLPVFQFLETADDDQIKKMMSTFVNLSKDQAQGVSFEESAAMIASIEGAESLEKNQNLKLAQELLDSNTESKTKILESSGNLSEQTHARAPQRAAAWDELPKKQPMISGLMDDLMKLDAKAVETFQTAREGVSILKRELSEAMAITVDMIEDQGEKIFEKMSGPLERIGIQKNALRFTRGKTMAAMGFAGIGGIVGLAALGSGIAGSVKPSRPPMAPKSRPMFQAQDFSADDEKHKMIRDEGSVAKMMRQENTDFGSGYRGVVGSGKALAEASSNTPGMLKSISSQASNPLKKSGIVHLDGVDEMSNLRIATNKRAPETVDFSSDLRVENTPQFDLRMKLHSDKINRKKKFKDVAEESSKMAFMSDFNKIRHHL